MIKNVILIIISTVTIIKEIIGKTEISVKIAIIVHYLVLGCLNSIVFVYIQFLCV